MQLRSWPLVAGLACIPIAGVSAQAPPCVDSGPKWELQPIPPAASWHAFHQLFLVNPCDDGVIGEAFSDFVVHKLATGWSSLPVLARLVASDTAFGAFVIQHIDGTTDEGELRRVAHMASERCPPGEALLCERISTAAKAALRDAQPN